VLIGEDRLRARVAELGSQIARAYAGTAPVLVGVLEGAFLFMADLIRAMPIELSTDFVRVESYGGGTTSSGRARVTADLAASIEGRDVLVVEDIVDTGHTVDTLGRMLRTRGPKSVRFCALCDKRVRREVDVRVDWIGFRIPSVFVVGYGLDYGGRFRNLPSVVVLDGV